MPEDTAEQKAAAEVAAKAAEAAKEKKGLDNLDPETAKYLKDLRKEAETNRKKLEAFEKEKADAEAKALTEKGEFKKLADDYKAKLDAVTPEHERLKAWEKAERDALLAKLPEDQREKWGRADLELLKDHVAAVTTEVKKATLLDKPGKIGEDKKWGDLTLDEKDELKKNDHGRFAALYTAHYTMLNGRPPTYIP